MHRLSISPAHGIRTSRLYILLRLFQCPAQIPANRPTTVICRHRPRAISNRFPTALATGRILERRTATRHPTPTLRRTGNPPADLLNSSSQTKSSSNLLTTFSSSITASTTRSILPRSRELMVSDLPHCHLTLTTYHQVRVCRVTCRHTPSQQRVKT